MKKFLVELVIVTIAILGIIGLVTCSGGPNGIQ